MSQDLTRLIVDTKVKNTFAGKLFSNKKITTVDKVFLPSTSDLVRKFRIDVIKKASDFAYMSNLCHIYNFDFQESRPEYFLRDPAYPNSSIKINGEGNLESIDSYIDSYGIAPALNVDINEFLKTKEALPYNGKVMSIDMPSGKGVFHTISMGEYPQTIVEESLENILEGLFCSGNLKEGLQATGKLFTTHFSNFGTAFSRQNPEFIYNGEKYVRVVSRLSHSSAKYSDGRFVQDQEVHWVKVEPIQFKIKNWDKLPKTINPKGNGRAKSMELESFDVILSGVAFSPSKDLEYNNLWQNSIIRAFLNSSSNKKLGQNSHYAHELDWDFSETGFLQQAFNLSRVPITEYTIPQHEKRIEDYAFEGCVSLKKIIVPSHVNYISVLAFKNCNLNYVYMNRLTGNIEFSSDMPKNLSECVGLCDLKKLSKTIKFEDYSFLLSATNLRKIGKLSNVLEKNKISINIDTAKELISNIRFETFIQNSDFRFFKNELKDALTELQKTPFEHIQAGFYKFATLFGCFSKQKIIDKHGKDTETILAQKASTFMAQIIKRGLVGIDDFDDFVKDIPLAFEPNQDFLKFITQQGKDGKLENLDMLMTLNSGGYSGIIAKVMTQFDKVKNYRTTLGPNGIPITVPWVDAIIKFDEENAYYGVTPENIDIANEFASRGLDQETFIEAINLRAEAKQKNAPSHILGEELKEDTILESIEKIKQSTKLELQTSRKLIDDLYAKRFTYEMLDKYDPKNAILGLYTSCCGTITSEYYGSDIARASILSDEVQNLVVKNYNGEIVAKGTIYLNKDQGYAVINDFEISSIFKQHEKGIGFYNVKLDSSEEQERDMIFKAFMRGIHAFVEKYDEKNPDKPIQFVNVGLGHNRLQEQCSKFAEATKLLTVPSDYQFCDAQDIQKVLYDRKKYYKNIDHEIDKHQWK